MKRLLMLVTIVLTVVLGAGTAAHATSTNYFQQYNGLDGVHYCTVGWGNIRNNQALSPFVPGPSPHYVQAEGVTYSRRDGGCVTPVDVPAGSTAVNVTLYKDAAPAFGGVQCVTRGWQVSYGGNQVGTYLLPQGDAARGSYPALFPVAYDVRQCGSFGCNLYGYCQYIAHIEHLGPFWAYGDEWTDFVWAQATP